MGRLTEGLADLYLIPVSVLGASFRLPSRLGSGGKEAGAVNRLQHRLGAADGALDPVSGNGLEF